MYYARVQVKLRKMDAKRLILLLFHLFYLTCGSQEIKDLERNIDMKENGVETSTETSSANKTVDEKLSSGTVHFRKPIEIIVGGGSVAMETVPYTVSLQYKGKHSCGGGILRNDLIITAAHCLLGYPVEDLTIRAGSISSKEGGTVGKVRATLIYPEYTRARKSGDIGLAWLDVILAYNDVIKPIDLIAQGQEIAEGTIAFVTGWGLISEDGTFPQDLQGVDVPVITPEMCKRSYGDSILPTMLCAGRIAGGKDSCTYDSGGPLVYNHTLIGIVSWGRGCARPNYPGVYAKIAALRVWIDDNMMPRPMKQ